MGGTGVGLSNTRTGTGSSARKISNESKSTIAQRQTMATMASVPSFDSLHSEVELFYDSDPGVERTRTRTPTCQSSSTSTSTVTCRAKHKSKNKKKKKNKNKKKTIHNHNLNETYTYTEHAINTNNTKLSLSRYKSSMASFDLESFDMNDTALVTELIQVRMEWNGIDGTHPRARVHPRAHAHTYTWMDGCGKTHFVTFVISHCQPLLNF